MSCLWVASEGSSLRCLRRVALEKLPLQNPKHSPRSACGADLWQFNFHIVWRSELNLVHSAASLRMCGEDTETARSYGETTKLRTRKALRKAKFKNLQK